MEHVSVFSDDFDTQKNFSELRGIILSEKYFSGSLDFNRLSIVEIVKNGIYYLFKINLKFLNFIYICKLQLYYTDFAAPFEIVNLEINRDLNYNEVWIFALS